jgi:hypothetical protein
MDYNNIEEVVREYIPFKYGASSKGWNTVYCEVCGDGRRTQGPRGGWLFANDMAFYNCFNCGVEGNFDPHREFPFSKQMYNIFQSFGVPTKYCYALITSHGKGTKRKVVHKKIEFDTVSFPSHFYPLAEAEEDNLIAQKARDHIINERRLDPDSFPFYLSTGISLSDNPEDINLAKIFTNRLIIPAYVNERLIGYEGMALGSQGKKYISIGTNLIHGHENIFGKPDNVPLFVTEGYWDSSYLNGVAVCTNKLSSRHIELLNRTNRPKIIVPDRGNTHNALADKALELDWGVSCPKISPFKDVSKAVKNYGNIYVINSIMENIKYGKFAKISLKLYNIS